MLRIDISHIEYDELQQFVTSNAKDLSNFELLILFRSDYAQSKMIRDLVLSLFEANRINVPWKSRFSLISDELVNNSIEYGSLPLDKNEFFIAFENHDGKLHVTLEVRDTGRGVEAKTRAEMEEIRQAAENKGFEGYLGKRGRGLFQLITSLVDELYFRDNSNGGLSVGIRKALEVLPK